MKKNTHQNIECDIVDNYVKSENVRGPISDQVLTHVAKKRFFLFKWLCHCHQHGKILEVEPLIKQSHGYKMSITGAICNTFG